jgi:hypothetical protein
LRPSASRTNGTIRCAISTRKSTDEGLEQELNTLDTQRESAGVSIVSQRHEGCVTVNGVRERADGGAWNTIAGQPAHDSDMALLLTRMLVDQGRYDHDEARRSCIFW